MSVKKKKVYKDCAKAMKWTLWLNILSKVVFGTVSVYMVNILAEGANYILYNQLDKIKGIIGIIIVCLIGTIIVIPVIDFIKNMVMLKEALEHDRCLHGHYLDTEYSEMRKIDKGEIQQRLEEDPIDLRFYWIEIIADSTSSVVASIILGYSIFQHNIVYAIIVVFISILRIIYPIVTKKYEKKYDMKIREYDMNLRGLENEYFMNATYLKRYKLTKLYLNIFKGRFQDFWLETKKKHIKYLVINEYLNYSIFIISYVIIIISGCFLLSKNLVSIGSIVAMIGYSGMIEQIYGEINFIIRKIPVLQNCCERISIFYNESNDKHSQQYFPEKIISIKDLYFKYDDVKIFDNFNCKFVMGEKNIIVGRNGIGKSTLIKILSKLEKDYTGSIEIDYEIDLREIDEYFWRKEIAVAFQNPITFKGTVRENIMMSNNEQDIYVEKIIQEIGLNLIADKVIDNYGKNLSGGELQKISIARALVKKPKILILDEPNNNLDINTKEWLKQFINNYKKTLIFISHDEELIKIADNIIEI